MKTNVVLRMCALLALTAGSSFAAGAHQDGAKSEAEKLFRAM
ncbi:MAG TPA: hypothetical protein VIM11_28745 [Tepidisphaeraceae bacterium]|jgi:hypothetical protein